jgi:cytoskeletal protein CcmA (bactofilin family)
VGFFSKPEEKKPAPAPAPKPSRAVPSPPPKQSNATTLIGPAAHIKGELVSSDNVHIEGRIEGKVKSTKQVIIGQKGLVQAEVEAETVSIRGKLEGDCRATGKVEITESGQVYGNIAAPTIAVSEGAIFRGASNMNVEPSPAKDPIVTKTESPKPTPSPEVKAKEPPIAGMPPKE